MIRFGCIPDYGRCSNIRRDLNSLYGSRNSKYLRGIKEEFFTDHKRFYKLVNAKRKMADIPSFMHYENYGSFAGFVNGNYFAELFENSYKDRGVCIGNYPYEIK